MTYLVANCKESAIAVALIHDQEWKKLRFVVCFPQLWTITNCVGAIDFTEN